MQNQPLLPILPSPSAHNIEGIQAGEITTGDAFLSAYSADQLSLQSYYKANSKNYDATRSVVFLFANAPEASDGSLIDAAKLGDMFVR